MKRLLAIVLPVCLLAVSLAALSGCSRPPKENTSVKVGVSVYNVSDTFVGELTAHMAEIARQLEQQENITITIVKESADGNQSIQNNQVESFIQSGCDIICVNLVDRTDVSLIIDMAISANIPILFFNRELVEEDLKRSDLLYYVGAEAMQSGQMQGEIVVDLYKRDAAAIDKNGDGILQYVMLEGEPGHQDAVVRTESSVATVMEAGIPVQRLEGEIANWVREQAQTKMTRWLELHGEAIELVFANNDDMALGAIDALERAGIPREDWPVVVGIDGTGVGIAAVLAGQLTGTVLNDAYGQAKGLVDLIYALHFGGEMPPLTEERYIRLPYQIITTRNVADFIDKPAK